MKWSCYGLVCWVAFSWSATFAAKKPKGPPAAIAHIFPAGGKAGTTFPCTVAGAFTKTEITAWADHPGIVLKSTDKPGVFTATIAPDVPLGPHLLRFYNDEGASPPRIFMVGSQDEVLEHSPQTLEKIPVTINGVLEKAGEADIFTFHAEAGRWVVLALDGYGLGGQMDPVLRLLDERGVEVAMNHDTFNLDPLIAYEVKKTGTYIVEVMAFVHPPAADVTLKGSADHVYRLTITDGPYARSASPCAVQMGGGTDIRFAGWNFGPSMEEAQTHKLPVPETSNAAARIPSPNGETVLASVVNTPVVFSPTLPVTSPVTISSRIASPKSEDRFRFTAKKGDTVEFHLHAASLHSPLDPVLHIEDAQGKVLKQSNDQAENVDPIIQWTASADGEFIASIRDLYSRGGWDFIYALECAPPRSEVSATLDATAYKIESGKTADLKVNVKLTGVFKGKLTIRAEGLPEGVTAKDAEVPAKGGEVKLTLSATAEVKAANQPFAVVITTSSPDLESTTKATSDLRGLEPRGDRLINESSEPWLTITTNEPGLKPE